VAGGIDSQDLEWIRVANQAPMLVPEILCILVKRESKYYFRPTGSKPKDRDSTGSANRRVQVVEIIQLAFVRHITFVLGGWR
jgi:hypothetical protein